MSLKCPIRNSGFTETQRFKVESTFKATFFSQLNKYFLIRAILVSGPGSKKHFPQQWLQDLLCKVSMVLVLTSLCQTNVPLPYLLKTLQKPHVFYVLMEYKNGTLI